MNEFEKTTLTAEEMTKISGGAGQWVWNPAINRYEWRPF